MDLVLLMTNLMFGCVYVKQEILDFFGLNWFTNLAQSILAARIFAISMK
jgi:hypothetical protein